MPLTMSLRKASKLRGQLENRLTELRSKLTTDARMQLSIYDSDVRTRVEDARVAYNDLVGRTNIITAALYELRRIIAQANFDAGVHSLVTEIAQLRATLLTAQTVAKAGVGYDDLESLLAEAEAKKSDPKNAYVHGKHYYVSAVSDDQKIVAEARVTELQLQLVSQTDALEELNGRTRVTLHDGLVGILTTENLIAV